MTESADDAAKMIGSIRGWLFSSRHTSGHDLSSCACDACRTHRELSEVHKRLVDLAKQEPPQG